ncbi:hypothetical protein CFC21_091379 [Triticum aestivum]|uniref:Cytochrome P450 n=3 Tax=Triticum aestivum TaxID=4565 RepID=A0A3B6U3L3_WHEAT|nr:desmethyl-deoxy-podophyllotoxin synthase-like [Triticum aestivum]KAF7088252.1 hypothetical protein CFC21_091379 [Triticum aestivum]
MAQQDQDVIMYYRNGLLLAAALLVPLLLLVRLRRPRGENLPPGPWRLPVIGSLHHLVGRLPHRFMRDLARRYDAPLILLRLGELDVVVASSADAAREVLKTQDAVFATRMQTPTIRALTVDGAGIALAPHGEHWRQARKLGVTELLGARPVQSLRGSREAGVAALVASIASASAASGPVNVSSLLSTYIIDVAVRALVGDRIGGDLRGEFLERLGEGVRLATGFGLADLFPSSRLVRAFSGSLGRLEALGRETSRVMDRIIDKHQHAGDEEKDFVDVMLRIQKNDGSLRAGTIRAMITDLFGAASDTSATTLEWAMAELMGSPAALRRAQAEVRSALAGESRVREEALPDLHYLRLVLKETLRLHPAAPLLLPRECPESRHVLGYTVPKGAMVLVNAWAIGRDAATWGADAEEFRPERFEEEAALDFKGTNFKFVPFGAGRRMCPGIAFGLAVVELALASFLFHFDWELPAGGLHMEEQLGVTARRKGDLWLHATVRVPVPALAL